MQPPSQGSLTARATWWAMEFSKLLARSAELRAQLPDVATFCLMPAEDPEVSGYNVSLALLRRGEEVVFIKLARSEGAYDIIPYYPHQAVRQPAA